MIKNQKMDTKIIALIAGAHEQMSYKLQKLKPPHWALTALGSKQLDITDAQAVRGRALVLRPALIINAAAYNAVDHAERERGRAFAVNAHEPPEPGPLGLSAAQPVHVRAHRLRRPHGDLANKRNPL